jgi:hypothetical protein
VGAGVVTDFLVEEGEPAVEVTLADA